MLPITSRIPVPAQRPVGPSYEGRHRAPEPTVEIHRTVGEGTRDRRPKSLRDWEGATQQLTPSRDESARIRAAAGVL